MPYINCPKTTAAFVPHIRRTNGVNVRLDSSDVTYVAVPEATPVTRRQVENGL